MPDVYGFDGKGVERIVNTVRTVEGALGQRRPVDFQVPNWQHVKVTGAAEEPEDSDYRYWPGVVTVWDAPAEEEILLADVWVIDRNDEDLTTDIVYCARESGRFTIDEDERTVFVKGAAGAGGSDTISFITCIRPETV